MRFGRPSRNQKENLLAGWHGVTTSTLAKMLGHGWKGCPAAWDNNEEWGFVVEDENERLLGVCGIHRIAMKHRVGELGYWVRTSATGQGTATQAARQICEWAFREQSLHRIEIFVDVENLPSQRVATKIGGVCEGTLRERLFVQDQPHDCKLFAVLRDTHVESD